jgi:hypothetical protein
MEANSILLEGTLIFLITIFFFQNSNGSAKEFDILPGTPNEDS